MFINPDQCPAMPLTDTKHKNSRSLRSNLLLHDEELMDPNRFPLFDKSEVVDP